MNVRSAVTPATVAAISNAAITAIVNMPRPAATVMASIILQRTMIIGIGVILTFLAPLKAAQILPITNRLRSAGCISSGTALSLLPVAGFIIGSAPRSCGLNAATTKYRFKEAKNAA